jgi:hypothetical protein
LIDSKRQQAESLGPFSELRLGKYTIDRVELDPVGVGKRRYLKIRAAHVHIAAQHNIKEFLL